MAARDILTLNTDIAPRLIRIVYALALILITLGMLAGIARGITRMVHVPQQRTNMIVVPGGRGANRMAQNHQQQQNANPAAATAAPSAANAAPPPAQPATASATPPAAPTAQPQQNGMMGPRMGMRGMHRGMMGGYMGMGRPGMRGPGMGMMGPRMGMRGMGGRFGMHRFGPHRFGGHRGGRPGLLGHLPPVAAGGLQVIRALVMGAIGVMLARILAELAGSVLAMGVKARQA